MSGVAPGTGCGVGRLTARASSLFCSAVRAAASRASCMPSRSPRSGESMAPSALQPSGLSAGRMSVPMGTGNNSGDTREEAVALQWVCRGPVDDGPTGGLWATCGCCCCRSCLYSCCCWRSSPQGHTPGDPNGRPRPTVRALVNDSGSRSDRNRGKRKSPKPPPQGEEDRNGNSGRFNRGSSRCLLFTSSKVASNSACNSRAAIRAPCSKQRVR